MRLMEETKTYPHPYGGFSGGNFAVNPIPDSDGVATFAGWQTCREVVQMVWKLGVPEHRGLWFAHNKDELKGIVEFMTWVEKTLCIADADRSRLYKTGKSRVVWIEPAAFWLSSEMRKNVFTLFLRVGRCYASLPEDKRTVAAAIAGYNYSSTTKVALERFLLGFHHYDGPPIEPAYAGAGHIKMGWHCFFAGKGVDHCRRHLKSA